MHLVNESRNSQAYFYLPLTTGGAAINSVFLYYRTSDGFIPHEQPVDNSTQYPFFIGNIEYGDSDTNVVSVWAQNSVGAGTTLLLTTNYRFGNNRVTTSAPRNAQATAGPGRLVVSWNTPLYSGGDLVDVYELSVNGNTITATATPFTTPNGNAIVAYTEIITLGSLAASLHTVEIRARNNRGLSAPVTVSGTPLALTAPSVSIVAAAALTTGTDISLSWSVDDGGSPLTGLTLLYGGTATVALPVTTRQTVIASLNKNAAYTLSLVAVNALGASPAAVAAVTTPTTPPSPPQSLTLAEASDGFLVVSWSEPADWGGSTLSIYGFLHTNLNNGVGVNNTIGADNKLTLDGLDNAANYQIAIYAISRATLTSSFSPAIVASPVAPHDAPTLNAAVSDAANTMYINGVSLSWQAPNNSAETLTVSSYTLSYSGMTLSLNATATATLISVAQYGVAHSFTLIAYNGVNNSPAGAVTATPYIAPSAPQNATVTEGDDGFTLRWQAPATSGGFAVVGYTLTAVGVAWSATTSAATVATLTGLAAGQTATVSIVAFSQPAANTRALSPAAVITIGASAVAPSAPQSLTAIAGNAVATLQWSAPASAGGAPILRYDLTYAGASTAISAAATSHAVANLANGTTHSFTLVAVNEVGASPAATAAATPHAQAPGMPGALAAAPAGAGTIALSWSAPANTGGASITAYLVYVGGSLSLTTAANAATLGGLSAGITYTLGVAAANYAATGALATTTATPQAAAVAPAAPVAFAAAVGGDSASLTWQAPANGGSPILRYVLSYGGATATLSAAATSRVVAGLTSGASYSFTLVAVNAVGASPAAVAAAALPAGKPAAPVAFAAAAGNGVVTLTWQTPANNGATLRGYRLQTFGDTNATANLPPAAVAHTLTGLVNGVAYSFALAASNAAGLGASATAAATPQSVAAVNMREALDKEILPAMAGVLAHQFADIVGDRLAAAAGGGGNLRLLGANFAAGNAQRGIAQLLKQHGGALANGEEVSAAALRNGSFALPLAAASAGGGVKMGVWGGAAYGNMSNKESAIQYDGNNAAYYTGIDAAFGDAKSQTRAGAVFIHNRANTDYTAANGDAGEYNLRANSGKGYFGWRGKSYSAHASFGFGKGEVQSKAAGGVGEKRNVDLYSAGFGGRAALLRGKHAALWGEADWSLADIRFANGDGEDSRAQNLRGALEASQQVTFANGGGVEPFLRAGYLRRFGAASANGWEMGAGFRWRAAARWRGELRARVAEYNNGAAEWSAAAVVRAEAANRRGLGLSIRPQYGESAAAMAAELTYGIATGTALWRPRLAATVGEATEYEAGAQWQSLLQNRIALRAALTARRKAKTTALQFTFGGRY